MRRTLVILALAVTMMVSPVALAFETIPSGHWAAQAVEDLHGEGVLVGYPDGTFRGNNSATRYELAVALKRLENVVNGLAANAASGATKVAGVEQGADADLATQVANIKELVTALQEASRQSLAADARRDKALNDLTDSVLALQDAVKADNSRLDALQKAVDELKARLAALDQIENQIKALQDDVKGLKADLKVAQSDIGGLKDQVSKLSDENSTLKSQLTEQKSKLQQMYLLIGGAALLGIMIK